MQFNFAAIKTINKKKNVPVVSIFKKHTIGVVIEECNEHSSYYFVLCDNIKYTITPNSYITAKKKVVYFKDYVTQKGISTWACIIRVMKEDRVSMPQAYLPFRPGYEVVGNIVLDHGKHVFDIKGCYKPNSNQKIEILKELENEEECQT